MSDGMKFQRTILDIALPSETDEVKQFTMTLETAHRKDLNNGHVILRALERAKEWLEQVVRPEADLRSKWQREDDLILARRSWPPK